MDDQDLVSGLEGLDALAISAISAEEAWLEKARDKQILPIDGWNLAIANAGRGFGKTETGAQWVRRGCGLYPGVVCHIVAPSHADLTGTMMGGISGILAVTPPELVEAANFSAAIPTIKFKNGSLIRGFTSQSPERLRGPQCTLLWGDEIAAWGAGAADTLTNIDMSTRIAYKKASGDLLQPQRFYTTTPKPLAWLKALIDKAQIVINGSSYENRANLAADWFDTNIAQYEGTQIGKQEIHGELLDVSEAAIIKRHWLRLWPATAALPWFDFIIVGLDTAFTEKTYDKKTFEADPTACQVWGVFSHERRWNMMLLERWSDHLGFPELVRRAKKELGAVYGRRSTMLFKPMIGTQTYAEQEKKPDLMIIEDKGSGISLRQMLAAEGIDTWPYNPGKADKLARLHSVSHVASGGPDKDGVFRGKRSRVWLPESTKKPGQERNWITPMLDELCGYSGKGTTKHDDDVDVFSMCARYFADNWMTAGMEGVIAKDSQMVNVNIDGVEGAEHIPGEDRLKGAPSDYEDDGDSYYG